MQYSIINYAEAIKASGFRVDAEYYHPEFIKNALLISNEKKILDFVDSSILNIKSSPINRDFEYLEIFGMSSIGYNTSRIHKGEEPDRAHYILQKGDVAVSTVRPNRNAVAFIQSDGLVGSSGLSILRAKNIDAEYLFAFCKTRYFVKCLVRVNKATMYPAVSNNDVMNTPILTPSINFQIKIKELILKIFAYSKQSQEIYKEAQTFLLAELGLTNWQSKHELTFVKNYSDIEQAGRIDADYYQPKYEEIINAIKGYAGGWDSLKNLVTIKKSIEVGSKEYLDKGIPFIRVSNLTPLEITEEKYISETLYEKIREHQPKKEEILFSKDGSPGIAYYLHKQPPKMIPSGGILRLKNKTDTIKNEYLTLVLNSVLTKEQVNRDVGGSIILHWRPEQVKETLIPILPEKKQTQIQQKIIKSFTLREQSKHLLECTKQAVEIAIEQNEQTAIDWLEEKRILF